MNNNRTPLDRRGFLKRAAGATAGAAVLTATGVAGGVALATPAESASTTTTALIAAGYTIEVLANNISLGVFADCSAFSSESEVIEHKIVGENGKEFIRKIPGRHSYTDVTLKRGVVNNADLDVWRDQVEAGTMTDARRTVLIKLYNSGTTVVGQWKLDRAWPAELVVGAVSGQGSGTVEEMRLVTEYMCREL